MYLRGSFPQVLPQLRVHNFQGSCCHGHSQIPSQLRLPGLERLAGHLQMWCPFPS